MSIELLVLEALRNIDPDTEERGICSVVDAAIEGASVRAVDNVLLPLFRTWPCYMGDDAYPVERAVYSAPVTFSDFCQPGKWAVDTRRGRLRRDLLRHCIKALEGSTGQETPSYAHD